MDSPRTMFDVEMKLTQELNPPGYLPLGLLEIHKPGKTAMIRAKKEVSSQQVLLILLYRKHNRQELLPGDTVSPFFFG